MLKAAFAGIALVWVAVELFASPLLSAGHFHRVADSLTDFYIRGPKGGAWVKVSSVYWHRIKRLAEAGESSWNGWSFLARPHRDPATSEAQGVAPC